jgi:hypothetical protein
MIVPLYQVRPLPLTRLEDERQLPAHASRLTSAGRDQSSSRSRSALRMDSAHDFVRVSAVVRAKRKIEGLIGSLRSSLVVSQLLHRQLGRIWLPVPQE